MEAPPVGLAEVARLLDGEATAFEFFQAVRLLERMSPEREAVGGFGDPAREVARFGANPAYSFPPAEIHALRRPDDQPPKLVVNFLGLNGPQGVLPLHYSQLVAERSRVRDTALRDFLDLFNHRAVSLFYRAWAKYRPAPRPEQGVKADRIAHHLLDLVGLGTDRLEERMPLPAASVLAYAGLLGAQGRPAVALEELLEDYFDVPVEVEQFVGGWYPLTEPTQCALGDEQTASAQLGLGAVVGDEVWDPQARVRIRIGPLGRARYEEFLPTGAAYPALKGLAEFFGGGQFDFEVQLVLERAEVPALVLGDDDAPALPLAWSTWLRTAPLSRDPDDLVFTL